MSIPKDEIKEAYDRQVLEAAELDLQREQWRNRHIEPEPASQRVTHALRTAVITVLSVGAISIAAAILWHFAKGTIDRSVVDVDGIKSVCTTLRRFGIVKQTSCFPLGGNP